MPSDAATEMMIVAALPQAEQIMTSTESPMRNGDEPFGNLKNQKYEDSTEAAVKWAQTENN